MTASKFLTIHPNGSSLEKVKNLEPNMEVSFMTIQESSSTGWDVVKKMYSDSSDVGLTTAVEQHCVDKTTAEVVAKEIARLGQLPFVPENISVISVFPLNAWFLPFELTPTGNIITLTEKISASWRCTVKSAQEYAGSKTALYLAPNVDEKTQAYLDSLEI